MLIKRSPIDKIWHYDEASDAQRSGASVNTELRHAEQRKQTIFECLGHTGCLLKDHDVYFTCFNGFQYRFNVRPLFTLEPYLTPFWRGRTMKLSLSTRNPYNQTQCTALEKIRSEGITNARFVFYASTVNTCRFQ